MIGVCGVFYKRAISRTRETERGGISYCLCGGHTELLCGLNLKLKSWPMKAPKVCYVSSDVSGSTPHREPGDPRWGRDTRGDRSREWRMKEWDSPRA